LALDECKRANERRNTLIHGVRYDGGPDGHVLTARSRRGTFEATRESWTDEQIRSAVSQISAARFALHDAMRDTFGNELLLIEYALSEETRALRGENAPRI
jgi:hypothetical protein